MAKKIKMFSKQGNIMNMKRTKVVNKNASLAVSSHKLSNKLHHIFRMHKLRKKKRLGRQNSDVSK